MGFKIEIVLISIAVLLVGCILGFAIFSNDEPNKISTIENDNKTSSMQEIGSTIISTNNTNKITVKININTASAKELEKLDGIGPALAQNIIEYRNKTLFKKKSDIINVDGIGQKKYLAIVNDITIE